MSFHGKVLLPPICLRTVFLTLLLLLTLSHFSVAGPIYAKTSPFFDLRNQPNTETEQTPDTSPSDSESPADDSPSDGAEETQPSDTAEQSEQGSTQERDHSEANRSKPSDTQTEDSQVEAQEPGAAGESTGTTNEDRSSEKSEESQKTVSEAPPRWEYHREPLLVNPDRWQLRRVDIPDTIVKDVQNSDAKVDTGSTVLAALGRPSSNRIAQIVFHPGLFITLGVLGLIGLYRGIPRRKVKIIKTANHAANKYLNRSRTQTPKRARDQDQNNRDEYNTADDSPDGVEENRPSQFETFPSPEELADLGIDPGYHELFRLREEGKTVEEITRQSNLGDGEVGLVFDLVERRARNRDSTQ